MINQWLIENSNEHDEIPQNRIVPTLLAETDDGSNARRPCGPGRVSRYLSIK
jgi:hypothetical protein